MLSGKIRCGSDFLISNFLLVLVPLFSSCFLYNFTATIYSTYTLYLPLAFCCSSMKLAYALQLSFHWSICFVLLCSQFFLNSQFIFFNIFCTHLI